MAFLTLPQTNPCTSINWLSKEHSGCGCGHDGYAERAISEAAARNADVANGKNFSGLIAS
jgi:hypothetical protein